MLLTIRKEQYQQSKIGRGRKRRKRKEKVKEIIKCVEKESEQTDLKFKIEICSNTVDTLSKLIIDVSNEEENIRPNKLPFVGYYRLGDHFNQKCSFLVGFSFLFSFFFLFDSNRFSIDSLPLYFLLSSFFS